MKRVGERGEGKWQRISWDEALDIYAKRLTEIIDEYGPLSLALHVGSIWREIGAIIAVKALGSPNLSGSANITCESGEIISDAVTIGERMYQYNWGADIANAQCILLGGHSPNISHPPHWDIMKESMDKGCKLIVVDPRRTVEAAEADLWLAIRPGTDPALGLGMINVILNERLYDENFVQNWTNAPLLVRMDRYRLLTEADILKDGNNMKFVVWDSQANNTAVYDPSSLKWPCAKPELTGSYSVTLKDGSKTKCKTVWQLFTQRVNQWPVERVAEICEVEADLIREAARMYATIKPATSQWRCGVNSSTVSFASQRPFSILIALTGNLDVKGGNIFQKEKGIVSREWISTVLTRLDPEIEAKTLGSRVYPLWAGPDSSIPANCHLQSLLNALLYDDPYPIKALIIDGSNVVLTQPDSLKCWEALKKPEFLVVHDVRMTPTCELADLVLPGGYWFDKEEPLYSIQPAREHYFAARQKIGDPIGEVKDDVEIFIALFKKLGYEGLTIKSRDGKTYVWKSKEEWLNWLMGDSGYSWEELKRASIIKYPVKKYKEYEDRGFKTPTNKVELFSYMLSKYNYDPLLNFVEPPESRRRAPQLYKRYPLTLHTGRREPHYYHGSGHEPFCIGRELTPDPLLEIHPDAAEARQIKHGDWVWLECNDKRAKFKANITENVKPYMVTAPHGWWYPERPGPEHGCFESNVNVLTSIDGPTDPYTGCPSMKALPCEVYKIEEE